MRPALSVVAERAVRYLEAQGRSASSREVARAVLVSEVGDESTATRILEAAFAGDARLTYARGRWRVRAGRPPRSTAGASRSGRTEPDRALLVLDGDPAARGRPFALRSVAVIRLSGDAVVTACAGEIGSRRTDPELRVAAREALEGAMPVVHDAPGAIAAFEHWLEEPIESPLSLRRLGRVRFGLPARHGIEALAARMGLPWRDGGDPVARAEILDTCLQALRRPGESLERLRSIGRGEAPPIPWARYAFDRAFLRSLPAAPGTYRFYDDGGGLLYVGRSADLRRRVGSYFVEGARRPPRVQRLVDAVRRIEIEPSGSDLEAVLREAAAIARARPRANVQLRTHSRPGRAARLTSILILEPAAPPWVLRAYLVRDGVLLDRVPLGPRGGGLARVARVLEERFFDPRPGPSAAVPTRVDVDLLARWLAAHRDRVVAFDPTHLKTSREVVARLRWFLEGGPLRDPDGTPIRYV